MKSKTNRIAYMPYVNWLTSFGGVTENEKDITSNINVVVSVFIIVAVILL